MVKKSVTSNSKIFLPKSARKANQNQIRFTPALHSMQRSFSDVVEEVQDMSETFNFDPGTHIHCTIYDMAAHGSPYSPLSNR
jgi:hypothetical protein